MQIVCFHNPDEENGYLSNWYPSRFTVGVTEFSSMEQFMMYKKAMYFKDQHIAVQILDTDDVSRIKELGRLVSGYDDNYWNGIRQIVVYEGLLAKFSQNADLRKLLLDTKTAILAECAMKDRIWGIGMSMQNPNRFDRTKWQGKNLLGYTLMMVRDGICTADRRHE